MLLASLDCEAATRAVGRGASCGGGARAARARAPSSPTPHLQVLDGAGADAVAHRRIHAQALAVDEQGDGGAGADAGAHHLLVVVLQQRVLQDGADEGGDEPPIPELQVAPPLVGAAGRFARAQALSETADL